ncbi:lysostaphin resistance A-like protein [Bacillus sp. Hm123]|uniref:CPBP family intramembrane glutamic endopeptidase n=1 Tax=Bacillus sp. Hm123 TaxID=3450745 RepID=UPI003F43A973
MKKEYGYILIVYVIMQLSSFIGAPLVYKTGLALGVQPEQMKVLVPGIWILISFTSALLIILLILRKSPQNRLRGMEPLSAKTSMLWAIGGVLLAFSSQVIAINIETMIGIKPGSDNTESIINFIEAVPATMIAVGLFGPILEEIVFRKVVFGSLYEKFSFGVSALISSFIFSIVHMDFEHILLYTAMGFTFAYLYVKTKRLIVPIFAHAAMNSMVVMAQYFLKDDIERMMKEAEQLQSFITWLS